ncbi:MAG: thiamine phosphate synthase [Solirubrobacterales bacterium]
MSLAPPDAIGPLRRERLRTARLYLVCEARPRGEDPELLLRAALGGGVDIVQLRDKDADRRTLEVAGQTFRRLCDTYSALFVVNDDPSLARACAADGVHVGQQDVAVAEARQFLGPDAIIGLSTHSPEQIAAAEGVDYISVGPVWETPTKEGRPAVGLDLVRHAAAHAAFPFYAIGGIDPSNAREVVEAGASGWRWCGRSATPRTPAPPRGGAAPRLRRPGGGARWMRERPPAGGASANGGRPPRGPTGSARAMQGPSSETARPARRSILWPPARGRPRSPSGRWSRRSSPWSSGARRRSPCYRTGRSTASTPTRPHSPSSR